MGRDDMNATECSIANVGNNNEPVASEKSPQTTIYDLPRQIWLDIYEHVDYTSYLNLRATCRHFQDLIDHYIGIRASFSTESSSDPDIFQFLTSVGILDVQFEDAKDSHKFNLKEIFAYPNFLNDVTFTGETSLKFVQEIAENCHSLQLLEMTMDCKIVYEDSDSSNNILPGIDLRSPFPPKIRYFDRMECFKLVPGIQNDNNMRSKVVLSLLRATKSKYLKKVIFQCELGEDVTLSNLLAVEAELIERHPNLEALFMAVTNEEFLLPETDQQGFLFLDLHTEEEFERFRNRIVSAGKNLKVQKMGLTLINKSMQLIWGDFLRTQQHLVHLSLTVNILPNTFSQGFFDAFCGTLEQLAVRGKFDEPFDFRHVVNCNNLKEICLHNLQDNGGGGLIPRCINMSDIPDGLESLILFQVVARTEEIQQTVRKLEKLSTLVVFKCGHAAGETGIGLECLQEILHMRTLHSILIVQFICGSTTEAEKLAGILYNMARDAGSAGPRRSRIQNNVRVPANEPEFILDLPEVMGNDDEFLLLPDEDVERPISRGSHRNLDAHPQEAVIEADSGPPGETSKTAEEVPGAVCGTVIEESWEKLDDSDTTGNGDSWRVASELPPTFSSNPNILATSSEAAYTDEFPPLEATTTTDQNNNSEELQNEPNEIENVDENNVDRLNVLQNILEQAMVADPALLHRRNPHLQDNMVLEQLHEVHEDVELILDIGDQDIGPVLDLFEAERLAREHNVQVGFILDGVIDIMNEDVVRSKWLCVEDTDGHLTYTLKISVEL